MESERSIDQSRSLFVVMLFTASTSLAAMGKITFDVTLVGRLGNTELAAFAFVFPVIFIVTSMGQGIYIATAASFTRGINILDHRVALRPMLYAFAVSLFLGILIAIALRAILPDVLAMLGAISHLDQLNRYFSIWLWTVPLIFVSANTFALIRNLGYLKIASAITLIATLVGVAFSPMLILEGQRGIVGSAYSTLITSLFSTFISLLFVLLRSVYSHAHLARTAVLDLARRIMAIALPVLLSNVLLFIFMSFATSVFSGLGEGAVAATSSPVDGAACARE